MSTGQAWIDRGRRYLLSGQREERNTLASSYTAGGTTLTLSSALGGITAGSRLSVGLNVFYVTAVNAAGLTATVLGGQDGSTDANASSGAVVRVNPRWTDFDILEELNSDLADLSGPDNGLFQMKTVDLTFSSSFIGYNLTSVTDLIDIYDVRYKNTGSAKDWPRIPKDGYRLQRNADTSIFASGLALQLFDPAASGQTVRVSYRSGFTALANAATALSTTGLPSTAYDLPPLGAAIRLMAGREVKRNQTEAQGDTRRAAEVPPGAVGNSPRGLMALRERRIQAEAARLTAAYPDVRW